MSIRQGDTIIANSTVPTLYQEGVGIDITNLTISNTITDAEDMSYTNESFTTLNTVEKALDDILNNLYYTNPSITIFSISHAGDHEVGSSYTGMTIDWKISKKPVITSDTAVITKKEDSAEATTYYDIIENDPEHAQEGTYTDAEITFTSNVPKTYNFTITYTDNHSTVPSGKTNKATSTKYINFKYRRYWGVTSTTTITDEQILALSSELCTGRVQKRTFDCTGGKYFWFVIPTSYCSNIKFKDGNGLEVTLPASCIETRTIENLEGINTEVNIYRGEYIQTSDTVVMEVL